MGSNSHPTTSWAPGEINATEVLLEPQLVALGSEHPASRVGVWVTEKVCGNQEQCVTQKTFIPPPSLPRLLSPGLSVQTKTDCYKSGLRKHSPGENPHDGPKDNISTTHNGSHSGQASHCPPRSFPAEGTVFCLALCLSVDFSYRLWDSGSRAQFEAAFPLLTQSLCFPPSFFPVQVSCGLHPGPWAPTPEPSIVEVAWVPGAGLSTCLRGVHVQAQVTGKAGLGLSPSASQGTPLHKPHVQRAVDFSAAFHRCVCACVHVHVHLREQRAHFLPQGP